MLNLGHYPNAADRAAAAIPVSASDEDEAIRVGRKLREKRTVDFKWETAVMRTQNEVLPPDTKWEPLVSAHVAAAVGRRHDHRVDHLTRGLGFTGGVDDADWDTAPAELWEEPDWDE